MNIYSTTSLAIILTLAINSSALAQAKPANSLPRSSPEAQGVSSTIVQAFIEAADKEINTMHSFMLVRHGHVVAECWWNPQTSETSHILNSLSKSFTSTAVGLVVAEGKLNVEDPVLKFFPDLAPAEPSENLKAMKVKDLLTMSTGHDKEPKPGPQDIWVKTFLAHPVPHKPGTKFVYNSQATYTLSAIVQKVTGKTVLEYLQPRLFEPLGIKNPTWGTSPQGITLGGWGLFITTEDIAKFGQLYLQKGKWNDKQLVPQAWVEAATGKQVENGPKPNSDWGQGYGYQFWQCRHGAYRGDGASGQFCIVLPEQDAVIAITAHTGNMQAQLNLVWDKLLPAFNVRELQENKSAQEKMKEAIASLKAKEGPPKK